MSTDSPIRPLRWPTRVLPILSLAAAIIAGYLLILALGKQGLPVGCGDDSGCAEVLTSRWSVIAGVPVSGPALIVYLTVLMASLGWSGRMARNVLLTAAFVLLFSAVWFVTLQLVVLRAICPWCMVEHGLGLAMAVIVLWTSRSRSSGEPSTAPSFVRCGVLGGIAFGAFVVGQLLSAAPTTTVRLPAGVNADSGPGPGRQIAVLKGQLQLAAHEEPIVGSPDAPKLLCVMFDYCCPHCRRTHEYLQTALRQFAGELAVISLPTPRDADCNPTIEQTESRFENACELAQLALAVWHVDAAAFVEYDRWLFASPKPRPIDEARAQAEQLVSPAELEAALKSPGVKQRIERNIRAYVDSGAQYIPVLISPGFDTIVGRPESEEALMQILRQDLFQNTGDSVADDGPSTP